MKTIITLAALAATLAAAATPGDVHITNRDKTIALSSSKSGEIIARHLPPYTVVIETTATLAAARIAKTKLKPSRITPQTYLDQRPRVAHTFFALAIHRKKSTDDGHKYNGLFTYTILALDPATDDTTHLIGLARDGTAIARKTNGIIDITSGKLTGVIVKIHFPTGRDDLPNNAVMIDDIEALNPHANGILRFAALKRPATH